MKKDLGAILLVAGTTIGAGMLALPAITAPLGLLLSLASYITIFLVMLISAKYLVKLVLHYHKSHNFVELAKRTLGFKGEALCWVIYLLLMYALVAAYISAFSSMVASLFPSLGIIFSETTLIILLPTIFAFFLGSGLKGVDLLNRFMMIGLVVSFTVLCFMLGNTAKSQLIESINPFASTKALTIIITAFGYHIIIPTITAYLEHDEKRITKALLYGSLLPLVVYIIWHLLVYLNLSQSELLQSLAQDIPITDALSKIHPQIKVIAFVFSLAAIITSFIGVALSLFDFLKDSLPQKTLFRNKKILFGLTFIPPIVYILYFKKAFYLALDHAGILVSLLLIILPALMFIKISKKNRLGAIFLIFFGIITIAADIYTKTTL